MSPVHKELASGRWLALSFAEQMAHAGSEVERAIGWRDRNVDYSARAFERALELLDLTVSDPRNRRRLRELCRLREVLVDYFRGENRYGSSVRLWRRYFLPFAFAARRDR